MGYSLLIAYLYQSDEGCEYGVFLAHSLPVSV